MTTTVQDSRLKRRFELWDTNHDGAIDKSDWEGEARRILKAFGEPDTSPKARTLMDAYLGMWTHLAELAGVGPHGAVTVDQFIEVSERELVLGGDAGFDRSLRPTIEAVVNLCDTDSDGEVNPLEFRRWMKAVGVSDADADTAFKMIDKNRNGQLTVEEIIIAVRDYHAGKHDIPLLGR